MTRRNLRDLERRIKALADDEPDVIEIVVCDTVVRTEWEPSDGSSPPESGTTTTRFEITDGGNP